MFTELPKVVAKEHQLNQKKPRSTSPYVDDGVISNNNNANQYSATQLETLESKVSLKPNGIKFNVLHTTSTPKLDDLFMLTDR